MEWNRHIVRIDNCMDVGLRGNKRLVRKFNNQKNFSYFSIDDFWKLKPQKELKKTDGFFDFSGDQSLFESLEQKKDLKNKTKK